MTKAPLSHTYEPNAALRALYARFFDRIQVDESWVLDVRRVAAEGTVVYVLRNLNFVDFLALDHLTKRFGLPQVCFANDLGLWVLNPTGRGFLNALLPRPGVTPSDELVAALESGGSAALFLKRPPGVLDVAAGASGGRGLSEGDALVRTLVNLQQREPARRILLVPQLFLWTKRPDTRGTQAMDFLLGPREWPSPMRTVGQFLLNYKHVELRAGEPLDLQSYLEESDAVSDDTHVRRITYAMLRRLERERRAATGPAAKPPDRVRHELLRSPKLRSAMKSIEMGEKKEDSGQLRRRADGLLRRLQATPEGSTISALEVLLDRVFHRIYAGVDVDRDGLARVREASKEGSVILLPSHKSHVDYLIVSYVFNDENMQLPMIAAGDNLSFFPLGPVFRRAGAFFIRRSFKGDRLYASVVDAYIRRLLREGFPIEVFLEGGRSRTGKLLPPKFGLLSMLVEAALALPSKKTFFAPISIGYERIVETHAYQQELAGGEKVKEDAAGLLKTTDVLKHRYGRINLQFGTLLTLDDIKQEIGIPSGSELSPTKRRAVITRIGNRVMDEINRVTAVTPGALTALALLSHHRRGLPHEELILRCDRFLKVLIESDARVTPATATGSGRLRPDAIREAAQMFARAELIEAHAPAEVDGPKSRARGSGAGLGAIYTIAPHKRAELDTSKNIILHFFIERALVATALLAPPGAPYPTTVVRDRVRELSRLFKIEFRFRADAPFAEIFEDTLSTMEAVGEISRDGDSLLPGPGRLGWSGADWLATYASIVQNFVEAYRIGARGLGALLKGPVAEKDLVKKALATGQRMFFSGELERSESISQPTVKNAFVVFKELGHLRMSDGKYELVDCTPEAVRAVEAKVAGYLQGSNAQ